MTEQTNNSIIQYQSQAIQRVVDRQIEHMRAKEAVGEAVIESGTELHDYAGAKIIEAAQFAHLMLQAAQQALNGSHAEAEEAIRQLSAAHREFVFQATGRTMASILRQAESMPVNPEAGLLARLGDGIAEARDEVKRLRAGD